MISRREFARIAGVAGIPLSGSAKSAMALSQAPQSGGAELMKAGTLPEWANHIDPDWIKETLVGGLLDYWMKASVTPIGFIQENLDREWKPWGTHGEASLNGQGRQLYSMIAGYELTCRQDYLDAVHRGADLAVLIE